MNNINTKDLSYLNIANIQGMDISSEEKLKKAAEEFEGVFITQLLNTMQSTVEKSGFMSGGSVEKKFRSMMNEYVAKDIASNPQTSFGVAKQIYEQMKDRV